MSRMTFVLILVVGAGAGAAYAQMGGGGTMDRDHSRTSGAQQSTQRMGAQMMREETMREMSRMMVEMREMLRDMSEMMDRSRLREEGHRQDMARLMERMSVALRNMSQHMAQGDLPDAERDRLRQEIRDMERMMDGLEADAEE